MIFKIKTDDKVAGIVIVEALSNAGIQHTIISKTDDYDQFTQIQPRLNCVSGIPTGCLTALNTDNFILKCNCINSTPQTTGGCPAHGCEFSKRPTESCGDPMDKGPEQNGWKSDQFFALYKSYSPKGKTGK